MLLDDAREAGEPVAALWASEGAIYGRYGFGPATRAMRYELQLDRVALRRDVALPEAPPQVGAPADALERIRPVFDRVRAGRPGMLDRPGAWWDRRIHDPEHRRDGAGPLRAAVQPGPDGEAAGYALFAAKTSWDDRGPAGSVTVKEVVAETPEAHAGLWRFLLGLDLVRTLQWRLAPDARRAHPPAGEQRRGRPPRRRRPVRAAARRRRRAVGAQLRDRRSTSCSRSTTRSALGTAAATACATAAASRTDAPADLALGAEALGAIYLGGTPLTALAAAGRVRELRPGALAEAATAFRGASSPGARRSSMRPAGHPLLAVLLLAADAAAAGAGLGGRALR